MVMAGQIVMEEVQKAGVALLPVDSEHNAIFQCLTGEKMDDVERVILTSSGGRFRNIVRRYGLCADQAINHPCWSMGPKISVDSATFMNKGLEIIEAKWLFDLPLEKIDVIVHPQVLFVRW